MTTEQEEGGARLIRRKYEATQTRENLIQEALARVESHLKTAQEELLKTVASAQQQGYSISWIATAAGVSRGRVYRWLDAANTAPAGDQNDNETDEEKEAELPW